MTTKSIEERCAELNTGRPAGPAPEPAEVEARGIHPLIEGFESLIADLERRVEVDPADDVLSEAGWPCILHHVDTVQGFSYDFPGEARRSTGGILSPLLDERGCLPPTPEAAMALLRQRIASVDGARTPVNAHEEHLVHVIIGPVERRGLRRSPVVVGGDGSRLADEALAEALPHGDDQYRVGTEGTAPGFGLSIPVAVTVVDPGTSFLWGDTRRTLTV